MLRRLPLNPLASAGLSTHFYCYALICSLGLVATWLLARRQAVQSRSAWNEPDLKEFFLYGLLGVVVGGRMGYVFFYGLTNWRSDMLYPFKIWEGGMSFHGSLMGIMMTFESFGLKRSREMGDLLDFAAPLAAPGIIAAGLVAILSGRLWPDPTIGCWIQFLTSPRCIVRLSELLLEGVVLGGIVWCFSLQRRPRYAIVGLFLFGYGLISFALEFLRISDVNQVYFRFDKLSAQQLLSAPLIVAGAAYIAFAHRSRTSTGNVEEPIRSARHARNVPRPSARRK